MTNLYTVVRNPDISLTHVTKQFTTLQTVKAPWQPKSSQVKKMALVR